ncbi:MAG: DinB family protein [Spirochaetaceae bacterium]|nr:DinB family protein [Spirochaetaceae bacterium]
MDEKMLQSHLLEMLGGGAAHIGIESALEGFPVKRAGERVEALEHSMWMLVEHLRIVNRDLIDWVTAEEYEEKPYPSGYWPAPDPPSPEAWENTKISIARDIDVMKGWIEDPDFNITAPLKRRSTHSALREILLTIAHNGYHIGQMVDLRALLGVPVKDS